MRVTLKSRRPRLFWNLNIVIPVLVCIFLFGFQNSGHMLQKITEILYGPERVLIRGHKLLPEFMFYGILLYGCDFFLGYLLEIVVSCCFPRTFRHLKLAFVISIAAELLVQVERMLIATSGILSPGHLIAEVLGTVFAFTAILIHENAIR